MKTFILSLLAAIVVNAAGAPAALRIGVFDTAAAGGQGASVSGLIRGLNRQGYRAEAVADFHMLTLLQYDVIYLSDVHHPGSVRADWQNNLTEYIRGGGSVLQTWHHHILSEVGVGVERVYGSRRMHVEAGHPAVAGVADFDAAYQDHIIERVGRSGTVILKNDAGQPVAVAGTIGKGKVISTGLALAIPDGRQSAEPQGGERALLRAFLAWLAPEVSYDQRLAEALKAPRLAVAPPEALIAAGWTAEFEARVGVAKGANARLSCDGAEVIAKGRVDLGTGVAGTIERFVIRMRSEPGKEGRCDYTVRATVGGTTLEEKVGVASVYGKPPPNERRGVWLHVGMDRHPQVVMPELKRLGLNMAIPRIAGGTTAFYASKVQPDIQDPLAPDGDWLAELVKHAHANGIELHPYVNVLIVEGRASPASLKRLRAEGRLQEGPAGQRIDWFCPSQEINFEAIERLMLEIATRYDVDGIQYDFIRYPNALGCFCAKCRAGFEKATGKPVAHWPTDVTKGPRQAEWTEYRCGRISALVQRVSTRLRKEAPKVKISAAVFRDWPACRESVGQDWVRWCREGWLDFVCPMNYTLDPKLFAERTTIHRQALPAGFPLIEGIGIQSGSGTMNDAGRLAVQIALARRHGAVGFAGFCYTPKHTSMLFEPLRAWMDQR